MRPFRERLLASAARSGSWLCLGLDPAWERLPPALQRMPPEDALDEFCSDAIDAARGAVCCVKPQSAHFEAHGPSGSRALERVIAHAHSRGLPVLLDVKRGDIGETSAAYARAAFEAYDADAATVNPYMGWDAVEPFAAYAERGVFVLCRNSNPSVADIQDLHVGGEAVYERVARLVRERNKGNLGLVGGATRPGALLRMRALAGEEAPLLVLGVGAQGARMTDAAHAANARGQMALVSASRAILFAGDGGPDAQRAAAESLRDALREALARS